MTTTKIIEREFVVQVGADTLPAVTLGAWSGFMNTYAVWPSGAGDSTTIRRSVNLQAGYYYVTGAVDNYGSVNINGQYNITLYNFDANISRTAIGNNTRIYHGGGAMSIVISATNTGGPRGVAVTISEELVRNEPGIPGIPNPIGGTRTVIDVGNLVWSTRSAGTLTIGRYQVTLPFRANITAHAWAAGGGGGGMDAGTLGGIGAPGLYNTTSFEVDRGDLVEVFVGKGGNGGSSSSGGAPGGAAGLSRTSINGDATKSFNGGAGSAAGPGGTSGGGGGGGGASGVLVNNVPMLVAGGGGGGGGAGNDGNGSGKYARRDATITKNAFGDYSIGAPALDVDNSGSLTLSAQTQIVEYNTLPSVTAPPTAAGSTKVFAFGYGFNAAGSFTRTVQTNNKVNLSTSGVLTFFARRGSLQPPVGPPEPGEDLHLEYSKNGSTWTNITKVPVNVTADTWLVRSPQIPAGAKVAGGVFLRYRQTVTGGISTNKDLWAVTSIFNGSPILDFRGERGQPKGGDGGGAGGGGGGHPGGQGGAVFGGDASGFAGQCGGNFPDNEGATTGTGSTYYKAGYAGGGNRGGGTGQDGRVLLFIEPISLMSIKVSGEWKQINQAFVKVSGTWQDINTVYVKIDNEWREINGAGQGDVTFTGNSQSYGTSIRSFA